MIVEYTFNFGNTNVATLGNAIFLEQAYFARLARIIAYYILQILLPSTACLHKLGL